MKLLYLPGGYTESIPLSHIKGIIYNFPDDFKLYVISPFKWELTDSTNVIVRSVKSSWINANTLFEKIRAIFFLLFIGVKTVRTHDIKLIYARDGVGSMAGYLISKVTKVPLVIEMNGILSDPKEISLWVTWMRPFIKAISCCIKAVVIVVYKHASIIFACTSGPFKRYIIEKYGIEANKIVVIDNAADHLMFYPIDKYKARKELRLDVKSKYIVFVGSFAPWHGLECLVEAANYVDREFSDVKFLLIGDGPEKNKLIQKLENLALSDKFIFTGKVQYEQVPLYINAGDICVGSFTSKRNDIGITPLKLFEYMACSKPVVIPDLPGINKYVQEDKAGIIYEPDNSYELANCIVKLLRNETLCETLGKNGRKAICKKYNWKVIGEFIANMCKKHLNN